MYVATVAMYFTVILTSPSGILAKFAAIASNQFSCMMLLAFIKLGNSYVNGLCIATDIHSKVRIL